MDIRPLKLFRSLSWSSHMLSLLVAIMSGLWLGLMPFPVQAQDTVPLEREPFGTVELTPHPGGVEIKTNESPGGLFLKAQLDPTAIYRLVLAGEGDPVNLRIRRDEEPYEYKVAPTSTNGGAETFVLRKTKQVEVLFYSDGPARYRLQDARLELCTDCDKPQGNLAGGLLQSDPYGAAKIDIRGDTIEISVGEAPGGIVLRAADGVEGTYQLTFTGQGSAFAMRSRLKDGSYGYTSAPQRFVQMVLTSGPHEELLIFSDKPGVYFIRDLKLGLCPTCVSPEEVSGEARFHLFTGLVVIVLLALLADVVSHKSRKAA